jgi:membrane protein DedA with SNARE-associated domain
MRFKKTSLVQVGLPVLLFATAITIASLTVGRDIYNGSRNDGLLSFAIVNLSGYLFFLFMPVEIAFIYYLGSDISFWALFSVAIGTALFSQTIDYLLGYSFSSRIIDRFIGRNRYERAEDRIRKYGNVTIFLFNLTPLSSPVISLAAGMLKYRKKDAFVYTVSGLVLKYIILTLIFI